MCAFFFLKTSHKYLFNYRSESSETSDILCCEFECRPYKTELERAGIKEVPILDFIAENV